MGNKRTKLNVFDVIIVAVVIAAVGVGAFVFVNLNKKEVLEGSPAVVRFSVEVPELDEAVADSFIVGEKVVYGKTNSDYGTVVDVRVEPYMKIQEDALNGAFVQRPYANKFQATVVIEATVTETATMYKGKTEEIQVGANMPFRGKGFAAATGFVVDITKQ